MELDPFLTRELISPNLRRLLDKSHEEDLFYDYLPINETNPSFSGYHISKDTMVIFIDPEHLIFNNSLVEFVSNHSLYSYINMHTLPSYTVKMFNNHTLLATFYVDSNVDYGTFCLFYHMSRILHNPDLYDEKLDYIPNIRLVFEKS